MKNKKFAFSIFIAALFAPICVLAADYGAWFQGVISNVINLIVWPVFAGIAIIGTVWVGIKFLTSSGDAGKFQAAGRALLFVVLGVIIALLANAIVVTITAIVAG